MHKGEDMTKKLATGINSDIDVKAVGRDSFYSLYSIPSISPTFSPSFSNFVVVR